MIERRSGVDLIQVKAGWVVVFDGRLLSIHHVRKEAIASARIESGRVLSDSQLSTRRWCMPRLQPPRPSVSPAPGTGREASAEETS